MKNVDLSKVLFNCAGILIIFVCGVLFGAYDMAPRVALHFVRDAIAKAYHWISIFQLVAGGSYMWLVSGKMSEKRTGQSATTLPSRRIRRRPLLSSKNPDNRISSSFAAGFTSFNVTPLPS